MILLVMYIMRLSYYLSIYTISGIKKRGGFPNKKSLKIVKFFILASSIRHIHNFELKNDEKKLKFLNKKPAIGLIACPK